MAWFSFKNELPVKGRTVLITGGSTGLGLSAARQLAAKGANVMVVARTAKNLEAAVEQIKAAALSPSQRISSITADVTQASECTRIIQQTKTWNANTPPDIVWCVSGSAHPTLFVDTPIDQFQTMMDSNYFSCVYMAHAILQEWLDTGSSSSSSSPPNEPSEKTPPPARHLIFTGSFVSFFSFAGFTPYAPSKAAIRSLSDSLSQEMNLYAAAYPKAPRVRVHTVFPATMPTQSLEDENRVKTDLTRALEEGDQVLEAEECARRAIRGLERGEEWVATSGIIWAVMTSVLGGSIRGGVVRGVVDTVVGWVMIVVMVFVRWDMDRKVRDWGRKHGPSGMISVKK
ncbi:3-ketodihydrosphingosine reductase tsc10 [Echria macrotheca]|uniref:3-dehydrosphinganine reductase n=1 Tax=Echria macrotheca TaxID=438768 RepID=A0AAJ0BQ21_9PEZI|nr:3-ketodihydrosphingosine reductase tsc10 [Echria macrotheca]